MPKISVVIPIYNVAQYLEKCIQSLMHQTLDDIEYIFIDDCSTDNSYNITTDILSRYPEKNIQLIKKQENGGLASVRRLGLEMATGEYIIHCDSDDWVDGDYYEKLYNEAIESGADIVIGDFICESHNSKTVISTKVTNPPKQMLCRMHKESFYCMLWNKLMRTNLLRENKIYSVPGINMWEDVVVALPALYHASKISSVSGTYYHYVLNPTSYTSNSANEKSYSQRKACIEILQKFFEDKPEDWTLLIDYWKCLSKSWLLMPSTFSPKRWKEEYPEVTTNINQMTSFSNDDLRKMQRALKNHRMLYFTEFPKIVASKVKNIIHKVVK